MSALPRQLLQRLADFLSNLNPKVVAHVATNAIVFALVHLGIGVPATVSAEISLVCGAVVAWLVPDLATDLRHTLNQPPIPAPAPTSRATTRRRASTPTTRRPAKGRRKGR